ncbi:hypothetical protein GCM10027296_29490 [Chitinimonas naiadis]
MPGALMTSDQAQQLIDLLAAIKAFFEPVGGIASFLLALGFLLSFAHGFNAGKGSSNREI